MINHEVQYGDSLSFGPLSSTAPFKDRVVDPKQCVHMGICFYKIFTGGAVFGAVS